MANEKVSIAAARELYGVVIGADGVVGRRGDGRPTSGEETCVIAKADAVVIGAGIMGASTAHFLTKLGFGRGRAGREAEDLRRLDAVLGRARPAALLERGRDQAGGARRVDDRERRGGARRAVRLQADRLHALRPSRGRAGAARDRPRAAGLRRRHVAAHARRRSSTAGRSSGSNGVALACFEPTSGYCNPVQTVESLVRSAQREHGLHVYEGCEVLGITTAAGRVTGVVTGDGEIATGVVVQACGPWGDRIGRMVGVDYPITFSREHEAIFDAPDGFQDFPVISDVPQRFYCRPYAGGKVLAGEGWPKEIEPADPETYDDGTDEAHVRKMVPKLLERVPSLAPTLSQANYGGAFVTGYSGVYDITEDWYPIVGEEEVGGYYSCFGGSGHGFKIGPAIGESLAAVIAGQEPRIDISSLSGSRFSEGKTFSSVWGAGNRA